MEDDSEGLGILFCVGVAEFLDAGDGDARPVDPNVESRELSDCLGKELVVADRRPAPGKPFLLLDRSLPFFPGVEWSNPPITLLITTDDAGELPGVSIMLPDVE